MPRRCVEMWIRGVGVGLGAVTMCCGKMESGSCMFGGMTLSCVCDANFVSKQQTSHLETDDEQATVAVFISACENNDNKSYIHKLRVQTQELHKTAS